MFENLFVSYGLDRLASVIPFGDGLINSTWLVESSGKKFILQKINQKVFKHPTDIATNQRLICDFFKDKYPGYLFPCPIRTTNGEEMYFDSALGFFRLFEYVANSHTVNVVDSIQQANEAAAQFGKFTALLNDFPVEKLKITLPEFHNLSLRYQQFENAVINGNKERIKAVNDLIRFLKDQQEIEFIASQINLNPGFKKRVTHHDSKINNVLFDDQDKGLCVIDPDTIMPGYFISDFGDMMRTYLSPVSEEEKDITKIQIREDYFKAIASGYIGEMKDFLSPVEKDHLVYAGKFMTYMQALRFLTDYLENDRYYGAKYEDHNYHRANNQVELLKKIIEKEDRLATIASKI